MSDTSPKHQDAFRRIEGTDLTVVRDRTIREFLHTNSWQPIETAPKDGTWILIGWFLLAGQYHIAYAFWHSTIGAWCETHEHFTTNPSQQPTHWMPRPPAPAPTLDV